MAGYDKKAGTHSPWMSDSLCEALINYRNVINNNKGNFQALLGQQNTLTTLLSIKQYTELSALQTELLKINSDIDIAQSINSSLSNKLLNRRSIIINQIDSKNIEITNLKNQLNNVSTQITLLQQVMSLENNLTQYQLRELNPFIFEKEFRDEKYTSDVVKDLYFAGVAQFHQLQLPKTTIKINIVDFLEIIECQNDWDKLNLGDLIYIEYPRFNLKVQAQITEMEQDYENRTVNLTISNIKDMETKEKTIIRLLYQTIGTSASVNTLTNQLNAAQQDLANIQDIINNVWNTAERKILSGVNDSVTINERGITTQPSTSSSKILRFNLGSLLGSNQGEDYLKVFIDGDGIKADKISGVLTVDDNSLKMEFKGSNIKKYFPNVNFDTLNSNSTSTNSTNEYVLSNDVGIKFLEALMTIYGGKLNINDNKGNNKIILEIDSTTNQPIITINNSDNTKTYTIKILSTGELQIGNDINNLTVSDTFTSLKAGNYIFNLNNSSVNIGNTSTGDYINLVNGNFTINCTGNISLNAGGTITANGNPI
jgi:hypothetical protein